MIEYLKSDWKEILQKEFEKKYFKKLTNFISEETTTVFPPKELIFNAFNLCPFSELKVVILGQDPYHNINQAHGLAFSVPEGIKTPPSLKNIFKELGEKSSVSPNLERWAKQGVLLLNTALTVRAHEPMSHVGIGWEIFTNKVIQKVSDLKTEIIFLLWGNPARKKAEIIDSKKHYILETTHPSPFSANKGFLGSSHFKKTNRILIGLRKNKINWQN